MVKLFFFIYLGFFTLASKAQNTILFHNFDTGFPAGWQLVNNDGLAPYNGATTSFITDAFVMHEDYDSLGVGDSVLIATSWHATDGEADDYLILPKLAMGGYGNYISFDAKSLDHTRPDGLQVRTSTGGIGIWEFFTQEPIFDNTAISPYWQNYTVSLDSLGGGVANEDVFICFRHYGNDQYILAIDNVKVMVDDPVGINKNSLPEPRIYVNGLTNRIEIYSISKSTLFTIMDISGKIISSGNTSGTVSISDLSSGIYLLFLNGYSTFKFSKG